MCLDPDPERFAQPRRPRRRSIRNAVKELRPIELDPVTLAHLAGGATPNFTGGLVVPKSRCCGAPIELTEGGLRREICSTCKQPAEEPRLKRE